MGIFDCCQIGWLNFLEAGRAGASVGSIYCSDVRYAGLDPCISLYGAGGLHGFAGAVALCILCPILGTPLLLLYACFMLAYLRAFRWLHLKVFVSIFQSAAIPCTI